jgi:dienelactone hydrolase
VNFFSRIAAIIAAFTRLTAAPAAGQPFELITFPDTDHDFVKGGEHYNRKTYEEAFQCTADRLKGYLGN